MTKTIAVISLLLLTFSLQTKAQINQTSPESALEAVFNAAKSGDAEGLALLCDPMGENDGDTECICAFDPNYDRNRCREQFPAKEFKAAFQDAKITSEPNITISNGVEYAEVPFLFGPGATRKETMNLVKRDGKWYLLSF